MPSRALLFLRSGDMLVSNRSVDTEIEFEAEKLRYLRDGIPVNDQDGNHVGQIHPKEIVGIEHIRTLYG